MRSLALLGTRAVYAAFNLIASVYCLLAYLPFTYHQIHRGGLIGWVDVYAHFHPWLNLAATVCIVPLLADPWRRGGLSRRLSAGFGIYHLTCAIALVIYPVLARLENNFSSFCWALVALVPLVWLAMIDIFTYDSRVRWVDRTAAQGGSHLAAAWRCGVFIPLFYAVMVHTRSERLALSAEAVALGWSILTHLVFFLGVFMALECVTTFAGLFERPAKLEFLLCHLLLASAITYLARAVIWPAMGFEGWEAAAFAIALGLVLALTNAGTALWWAAESPVADGISATASPAALGLVRSARSGAATLLAVGITGWWLTMKLETEDWNHLLQKLAAWGIWLATYACFYLIAARSSRTQKMRWLAAPLVLLSAYKGLQASGPSLNPALEAWAERDASLQLARQLLSPAAHEAGEFFQFLSKNTNIAATVHVQPVPIELAEGPVSREGPRPNIFIFTIDSLRRDYLAPYNQAVSFTPEITRFAQESTVFENAFTRYGGTGLSEPAIWSGAMLLHKQYITPFAPMNALEKLVNAEGYQKFLSRDSILDELLTPSPSIVDLDPRGNTMTLDFAQTLDRLQDQLKHGKSNQPIFVYTQPQNVHISVIQRERASVPDGEAYPGFYAPYASRLKRIDAAFGKFIEFLKARNLYDHSIIVLTADHGDSLGEGGRWGHSYTLFPEILRIPLIVHLPKDLRAGVSCDPAAVAFSTDITPTLYYLLGHRPIRKNAVFGSPLFAKTPAERIRDSQASYLLASSYAAVYGILSNNGRRLYLADGVNYQHFLFDLDGASMQSRPVNPSIEQEQDALIRKGILDINGFYRFERAEQTQP